MPKTSKSRCLFHHYLWISTIFCKDKLIPIGPLTLVGQHPMKLPFSSVPLPITKLSQDWIISFFLILYMIIADIYSLTEPNFWKTNLATRIWAIWTKIGSKMFFCHFLRFSSLIFLEITYNASLQQCLTSSRDKIHGKKCWGSNLGQRDQNQSWN